MQNNTPAVGLSVLFNQGGTLVPAIIQSAGDDNVCRLFVIGPSSTSYVQRSEFGTSINQWSYLTAAGTQRAGAHT